MNSSVIAVLACTRVNRSSRRVVAVVNPVVRVNVSSMVSVGIEI